MTWLTEYRVLRSGFAVLGLVGGVLTPNQRAAAQESSTAGRPLIVVVHGRNQANRITAAMEREWREAILDGFARVRGEGVARQLGPDDFAFASYSDVYEFGGAHGVSSCAASPPEIVNGGVPAPSVSTVRDLGGPARRSVPDLVELIPPLRRLFASAVWDTDLYLSNEAVRCRINERLVRLLDAARLARRPVILVTHSMGGMIAYDVLTTDRERLLGGGGGPRGRVGPVHRLVLLGSQLPSAEIRRLVARETGHDSLPVIDTLAVTDRVILARGRYDYVAMRSFEGRRFVRGPLRMEDVEIDTDMSDPHAFRSYLKHPAVAIGILAGWCTASTNALPGCEERRIEVCDFDRLARPYFLEHVGGDSAVAERRLAEWRRRGGHERPTPVGRRIIGAIMPRSTPTVPSLSGASTALRSSDLARCREVASDIASRYSRNPSDSSRSVLMTIGAALRDRSAPGTLIHAEVGTSLIFLRPRVLEEVLPAVGSDVRLVWTGVANGGPSAPASGLGFRVALGGAVYVQQDLARDAAERRVPLQYGLSLGQTLSRIEAMRWFFRGSPSAPAHDLYLQCRPAPGQGIYACLSARSYSIGLRYVTF